MMAHSQTTHLPVAASQVSRMTQALMAMALGLFVVVHNAAVVAGFVVGAIVTVQQFGTVPLILKAEVFEKATEHHDHDIWWVLAATATAGGLSLFFSVTPCQPRSRDWSSLSCLILSALRN
jgi:hypothetical protein